MEPPDPDLQPPDPLTDDEPGPPPAMAADFAPGSAPDDAIASEDDEDVDGGDQVGEPVIANVLGGTVIAQSPE